MHLQANGPFSIGGTSGVIQLASALEFSTAATYTVTVQAQVCTLAIIHIVAQYHELFMHHNYSTLTIIIIHAPYYIYTRILYT